MKSIVVADRREAASFAEALLEAFQRIRRRPIEKRHVFPAERPL
jgi:hypothetical protein